jgi:hypothetical protein
LDPAVSLKDISHAFALEQAGEGCSSVLRLFGCLCWRGLFSLDHLDYAEDGEWIYHTPGGQLQLMANTPGKVKGDHPLGGGSE